MKMLTNQDGDYQSADFERGFIAGVESVLYIRCMTHREVSQLNKSEGTGGGECPICPIDAPPFGGPSAREHVRRLQAELQKEINKWRNLS